MPSKVGANNVAASGTLLIGGPNTTGTVVLEDLNFVFAFLAGTGPPSIRIGDAQNKTMTLYVSGLLGDGKAWWLPQVGIFHGQALSLLCAIAEYSSIPTLPAIWKVEYTFYTDSQPLLARPA